MIAALLAFLPVLGAKLPSIATLKLIAVGLISAAAVAGWAFGFMELAEVEKLRGQHQAAIAKANGLELHMQKVWDRIGAKDEQDYLTRLDAIQAETQRQSQQLAALKSRENYAEPMRHAPKRGRKPAPAAAPRALPDADVIGVLRRAAGGSD